MPYHRNVSVHAVEVRIPGCRDPQGKKRDIVVYMECHLSSGTFDHPLWNAELQSERLTSDGDHYYTMVSKGEEKLIAQNYTGKDHKRDRAMHVAASMIRRDIARGEIEFRRVDPSDCDCPDCQRRRSYKSLHETVQDMLNMLNMLNTSSEDRPKSDREVQ
jgi:hypothetical protein